jgi:hypothetical protein
MSGVPYPDRAKKSLDDSGFALLPFSICMKTSPITVRVNTVRLLLGRARALIPLAGLLPAAASAQTAFTRQPIEDKFEAANPALKAAQLNIDESRALETTAYLRPNPSFTGTLDQIDPLTTISLSVSGNSVYLDAEKAYRDTRLAYLNPIGSYLAAAAQMNMAAGREVIQ